MIRQLSTAEANFEGNLQALLHADLADDLAIDATVAEILTRVRTEGDAAVLEYTKRFERLDVNSVADLEISQGDLRAALACITGPQRQALESAAQRIRRITGTNWRSRGASLRPMEPASDKR